MAKAKRSDVEYRPWGVWAVDVDVEDTETIPDEVMVEVPTEESGKKAHAVFEILADGVEDAIETYRLIENSQTSKERTILGVYPVVEMQDRFVFGKTGWNQNVAAES